MTTTQNGSGQMFDNIARRYDLLNRLMSFGLDVRWRRALVDSLALPPDAKVLDLATGTGDVALEIARLYPTAQIIGVDPSRGMLDVGEQKIDQAHLKERVSLQVGDAQALSFEAASFDAVTIAFGIRNVPDRVLGLREMFRVLRPGGRLGILELAEPDGRFIGPVARWHVHHVLPTLGAVLSGQREYRYLQKSIQAFPHRSEFVKTIASVGFQEVQATPLTFGSCVLFTARVP